jgi:hypothetical protein
MDDGTASFPNPRVYGTSLTCPFCHYYREQISRVKAVLTRLSIRYEELMRIINPPGSSVPWFSPPLDYCQRVAKQEFLALGRTTGDYEAELDSLIRKLNNCKTMHDR